MTEGFRVLGSGIAADVGTRERPAGRCQSDTQAEESRPRGSSSCSGRIDIKDHTRVGLVSPEDREELKRLSSAEKRFSPFGMSTAGLSKGPPRRPRTDRLG